jgi:hypothetical protein
MEVRSGSLPFYTAVDGWPGGLLLLSTFHIASTVNTPPPSWHIIPFFLFPVFYEITTHEEAVCKLVGRLIGGGLLEGE